jgi:hypothetical protein
MRSPDIGLKTTKGVPIVPSPPRTIKVSFHQELIEQDCMACHSDHQGPKLTKRSRKPFSHALLKVAVRDSCCESAIAAPKDTLHRDLKVRVLEVPRQRGLEAGHLRPRQVRSCSTATTTPILRDLPQEQRLQPLHLLRLPRAHARQGPGRAPQGRNPRLSRTASNATGTGEVRGEEGQRKTQEGLSGSAPPALQEAPAALTPWPPHAGPPAIAASVPRERHPEAAWPGLGPARQGSGPH